MICIWNCPASIQTLKVLKISNKSYTNPINNYLVVINVFVWIKYKQPFIHWLSSPFSIGDGLWRKSVRLIIYDSNIFKVVLWSYNNFQKLCRY